MCRSHRQNTGPQCADTARRSSGPLPFSVFCRNEPGWGRPDKPQSLSEDPVQRGLLCVDVLPPSKDGALGTPCCRNPEARAVRVRPPRHTPQGAAVCLERPLSGSVPLRVSCSHRDAQWIFTGLLCKSLSPVCVCGGVGWGRTGEKGRGRRGQEQAGPTEGVTAGARLTPTHRAQPAGARVLTHKWE